MKRLALAIAFLISGIAAALAQANVQVIGPITPGDCPQFSSTTVIKDGGFPCNGAAGGPAAGVLSGTYPNPSFGASAFANPTGAIGLSAVPGSSGTAMRSDAAPPLSASVQSALTRPNGQILIGTGAFGFSSIPAATYTLPGYGAACDGVTDDTAAFNTLLTTVTNAGGGVIQLTSICKITSGALLLSSSSPKPIRITGTASQLNYGGGASGPGGLDLTFNATIAKIDARSATTLELDHLVIKDSGADCAPFIQVTNTSLNAHDNTFIGTAAQYAACNDVIIFGGTNIANIGLLTSDAPFQGYSTRVSHNSFSKIRSPGVWRAYANAIMFDHNTIDNQCGSNVTTAITAATNAAAAVLTITGHGFQVGVNVSLNITGATGNWTAINGVRVATPIDANTVSIPVNSTTFGALTGSPVFYSGAALVFNGNSNVDGGNVIESNLVEMGNYGYFARIILNELNNFTNNMLFDTVAVANYRFESGASTAHFISNSYAPGTPNIPNFVGVTAASSGLTIFDSSSNVQGQQIGTGTTSPFNFVGGGTVNILNQGGLRIAGGGMTTTVGINLNGTITINNANAGITFADSGGIQSTGAGNFGTVTTTGSITMGAGSQWQTTGRSKLYSPADGQFVIWNNAQTGFNALLFGGQTAAFPELNVSGTTLQAKLADGSGTFSPFAASNLQTAKIYSAAGTPLPTCNAAAEGTHASVSDATAPTYGSTYTSGGTVHSTVYCNGTNWIHVG